jgi:iron complex outermembrane receptor protein
MAVIFAESAVAQKIADDEGSERGVLQEVTVTAEKVVSTEQKTPIAMSVYTSEDLKALDIHDMTSLASTAPDVNVNVAQGRSVITIRGISSRDGSTIADPAVSVGTDGVYMNRPYGLGATLFDLERIEILRGPQGTLNGRNAVGGTINIVTAKPTDVFSGAGSLTLGNYNTLNTEGMLNLPLSDTVQTRFAFVSRHHDGYRDNAPMDDGNDEDAKAMRATVAFRPTDNFRGFVQLQYTKLGGVGDAANNIPIVLNPDNSVSLEMPPGARSAHRYPNYARGNLDLTEKTLRYQFAYDFGPAVLTYLGGYDSTEFHERNDNSVRPTTPYWFNINESPRILNQEIRLASDTGSALTWSTGAYYYRESSTSNSYNAIPTATSTAQTTSGGGSEPLISSLAAIGQVGYAISPTFRVSAGARYNIDRKRLDSYSFNLLTNYFLQAARGAGKWTRGTYHAGFEWDVAPKSMVYLKFDTGYKPGGFTTYNSYGPETIETYELGLKSRFLEDSLQLNVSGYWSQDKGQQFAQWIVTPAGGYSILVNAGSANIWGVEPSLLAVVPKVGKFNLSVDYLNAEYKDFVVAINRVNTQLAGNKLPQAPSFSVGAGWERSWSLQGGAISAAIQTRYQSGQYMNYLNYPLHYQKANTQTNLNLSYTPDDSHWTVSAYGRNLEDSIVFANATLSSFCSGGSCYSYNYMPPRTYGVSVSASF